MLQLTRWCIQDEFRKKQYQKGDQRLLKEEPLGTTLMETRPDTSSFDLEKKWDEEWSRNVMEAALERVKEIVSSRYNTKSFYLHVCKQMTARLVAERLEVKLTESLLRQIHRLPPVLQREIRHLEDKVL